MQEVNLPCTRLTILPTLPPTLLAALPVASLALLKVDDAEFVTFDRPWDACDTACDDFSLAVSVICAVVEALRFVS